MLETRNILYKSYFKKNFENIEWGLFCISVILVLTVKPS